MVSQVMHWAAAQRAALDFHVQIVKNIVFEILVGHFADDERRWGGVMDVVMEAQGRRVSGAMVRVEVGVMLRLGVALVPERLGGLGGARATWVGRTGYRGGSAVGGRRRAVGSGAPLNALPSTMASKKQQQVCAGSLRLSLGEIANSVSGNGPGRFVPVKQYSNNMEQHHRHHHHHASLCIVYKC